MSTRRPLCFERYRAELNRTRSRPSADDQAPLRSPFADRGRGVEPGERQIAHRRRMLEHLRRQSTRAS